MEDFFKQFRHNLDRRPKPGFEEQDWLELEKRLPQPAPEKRPLPLFWWLALPLVLGLGGSNVWLYKAWQQTNRKIANLETRRETNLETHVVYVTDTIYRTRVLRERVVEYLPATYASTAGQPTILQAGLRSTAAVPDQTGNLRMAQQEAANDSAQRSTTFKKGLTEAGQRVEKNMPLLNPVGRYLAWPAPTSSLHEITAPLKKQQKTLQQQLYTMRPKGFELGVTGSWASPFSSSRDLHWNKGFSVGLEAAVEFSPRLRLWTDATYLRMTVEAGRMGDDLGVPLVVPPSDNLAFVKAELPQPALQYALGMEYLFRPTHKLRPSLGLGYGLSQLLPYVVVYQFDNKGLGITWMNELQVRPRAIPTHFGLLRLGIEYQLSKHWLAEIRATYRSNLHHAGFQPPEIMGLQGGLDYRF